MIDKNYCMSSYMAFRYIEKDDVDFYEHGGVHRNITPVPDDQRILVSNSDDIDHEIRKQMEAFNNKKKGILLSGGMDSAIVASYLSGSDAYTFRFLGGDYQKDVFSIESSSSYMNAFAVAEMPYYDPYAKLKMAEPLDLYRVRHGEPKYLIRELMAKKYPEIPVPNKVPMPRPVDEYFKTWEGPKRPEFRNDINIEKYSGNQKWQMYCLEKYLDLNETL